MKYLLICTALVSASPVYAQNKVYDYEQCKIIYYNDNGDEILYTNRIVTCYKTIFSNRFESKQETVVVDYDKPSVKEEPTDRSSEKEEPEDEKPAVELEPHDHSEPDDHGGIPHEPDDPRYH